MRFADPTLLQGRGRYVTEYQAEVPGEVTHHRIPGWLSRRLVKAFAIPRSVPGGWSRLEYALRQCGDSHPSWLDHAGYASIEGRACFVSEPYGLTITEVARLVEFCRRADLRFEISAASHHFPTQTLRITFWPPREDGGPGGPLSSREWMAQRRESRS